jgi:hypothetical protein
VLLGSVYFFVLAGWSCRPSEKARLLKRKRIIRLKVTGVRLREKGNLGDYAYLGYLGFFRGFGGGRSGSRKRIYIRRDYMLK